jgi:sterol desaturase/sphingolipid hydroxylase (fatty acid hydroxylase superfamily)
MEKFVLLIPVLFVAALVAERIFPARPLPRVRHWLLKGVLFFVLSGTIHTALPALVAHVVGPRAPLHLAAVGTLPAAALAFIAADFVSYTLHRLFHRSQFFWKWSHQLHHSAERLDIAGFAYTHPVDSVLQTALTSGVIALLGVGADSAALAGFLGFVYAVFQHLNIRTPQWLGYVIQRPESHSVHHARGVHAYNYGNFPLWDLAFGTFRNPPSFVEQAGFWDGASAELGAMLTGRDVSRPEAAR